MRPAICLGVLAVVLAAGGASAAVRHVKVGASGSGASWTDAFGTLQQALDAAGSGDSIWVAAGTYRPTSDHGLGIGDRGKHFRLKNGVAVYGGFPATGDPTMDDRDPGANETILSGDLDGDGEDGDIDDAYHVFYHPAGTGLDATAVLDGLTIAGGYASNESFPHAAGGGMYNKEASPTVVRCTFADNEAVVGGGMYNYGSSPVVTDCLFSGNRGGDTGGMYNAYCSTVATSCVFVENMANGMAGGLSGYVSDLTVTGCSFLSNTAGSAGGMILDEGASGTVTGCVFSGNSAENDCGAMWISDAVVTVADCLFSGNAAGRNGGGVFIIACAPVFVNCTFAGNAADDYGGGVYAESGGSPTFVNSILWGNDASLGCQIRNDEYSSATLRYSCFANQAGDLVPGAGLVVVACILENPRFVAPAAPGSAPTVSGDYRLDDGSPCIDAGLRDLGEGGTASDADVLGNPRYDDAGMPDGPGAGSPPVDIGAYERQSDSVARGDVNGDGETDTADVVLCLRMAAGYDPPDDTADMNDDGTVDLTDVILLLRSVLGLP